jgi:hypothetical protein
MERVPGCEVIFTDPSIFLQRTSKTMYMVVHINGFTAGGYAALGSLGHAPAARPPAFGHRGRKVILTIPCITFH